MSERPNSREALAELRQSLQAREILQTLDLSGGKTNDDLLYQWLAQIGLAIAGSDLQALLDRLEREGLVATEACETKRVVTLTREGREVGGDVTRIDWIASR